MSTTHLVLLVDGMLLLAAAVFGFSGRIALSLSIPAATALLATWQWILKAESGRRISFRPFCISVPMSLGDCIGTTYRIKRTK